MSEVLLTQPGGFEGLSFIDEGLPFDDLSVRQGPDMDEAVMNLGVAPFDPTAIPDEDHDLITGIDKALRVDSEVVKGFNPLTREVLGRVNPRGENRVPRCGSGGQPCRSASLSGPPRWLAARANRGLRGLDA
jgi:hypothetical protein